MPPNRLSGLLSDEKIKRKSVGSGISSQPGTSNTIANPPPSYSATDPLTDAEEASLTTAFSTLHISNSPSAFPEVDHCLAHLKLLYAFNNLKIEVGCTDGLFGLQDTWCEKYAEKDDALASIREKRWSIYVARAVERYQAWWEKVLCPREHANRLTCQDMINGSPKYVNFTDGGIVQKWTKKMLPPLDVLMVWHAHMLNPRNYLEDCARYRLKDLWTTGMPWAVVNSAINTSFAYDTFDDAKSLFTVATGYNWDNLDDPTDKVLQCPRCNQAHTTPWTSTWMPVSFSADLSIDLDGAGYGDKSFLYRCGATGQIINHEILKVVKFKNDAENLVIHDWPLGSTLLSSNGKLEKPDARTPELNPIHFPNRLVKHDFRNKINQLLNTRHSPEVGDIKKLIEEDIKNWPLLREINKLPRYAPRGLTPSERIAVRKMMSRYWDNPSIFALELGGAVIRQSHFVEKMRGIDWLHSPSARETMARLLKKYANFMSIIFSIQKLRFPQQMCVPTLDVDLAWHTAQLSPRQYYEYSIAGCDKFVDHDDKISEDKLSDAFEWTSKTYEKQFKEVYSECTCWYCETIRTKYASSLFGSSKPSKLADNFYASGAASFCPPNKSAHISSHNAVRVVDTTVSQAILERQRQKQRQDLDKAFDKACKRADAKGRPRPTRDDFEQAGAFGGKDVRKFGPFMAVVGVGGAFYFVGGAYEVNGGVGMDGACAVGTCGGLAGAGGCSGSLGACSSTGDGGSGGGDSGGGGGGGCGGGCGGGGD